MINIGGGGWFSQTRVKVEDSSCIITGNYTGQNATLCRKLFAYYKELVVEKLRDRSGRK